MPCLWYNMYVIYMNEEYDYYKKTIKPLEKKYNKFSFLYSMLHFNIFKIEMNYYDLLLTMYYKKLTENFTYYKKIENILEKNSQKL